MLPYIMTNSNEYLLPLIITLRPKRLLADVVTVHYFQIITFQLHSTLQQFRFQAKFLQDWLGSFPLESWKTRHGRVNDLSLSSASQWCQRCQRCQRCQPCQQCQQSLRWRWRMHFRCKKIYFVPMHFSDEPLFEAGSRFRKLLLRAASLGSFKIWSNIFFYGNLHFRWNCAYDDAFRNSFFCVLLRSFQSLSSHTHSPCL